MQRLSVALQLYIPKNLKRCLRAADPRAPLVRTEWCAGLDVLHLICCFVLVNTCLFCGITNYFKGSIFTGGTNSVF